MNTFFKIYFLFIHMATLIGRQIITIINNAPGQKIANNGSPTTTTVIQTIIDAYKRYSEMHFESRLQRPVVSAGGVAASTSELSGKRAVGFGAYLVIIVIL